LLIQLIVPKTHAGQQLYDECHEVLGACHRRRDIDPLLRKKALERADEQPVKCQVRSTPGLRLNDCVIGRTEAVYMALESIRKTFGRSVRSGAHMPLKQLPGLTP
jgi:hypothetical protein